MAEDIELSKEKIYGTCILTIDINSTKIDADERSYPYPIKKVPLAQQVLESSEIAFAYAPELVAAANTLNPCSPIDFIVLTDRHFD